MRRSPNNPGSNPGKSKLEYLVGFIHSYMLINIFSLRTSNLNYDTRTPFFFLPSSHEENFLLLLVFQGLNGGIKLSEIVLRTRMLSRS